MTKLLLIASVLLISNLSQAQSFKVVKIQGKKAIVEVSDPTMISLNQTYNVGDSSMPVSTGGKGGKRDHAIAAAFSFTNQTSPTSSSVMELSGAYLWNFKSYEVGPVLGFGTTSGSGTSSSSSEFGALGFYNFSDNKPGVETLWSVLGKLSVASVSSGGASASQTRIEFGPNYRWFLLSPDHCFSMSGLYYMYQQSGTSVSGIRLEAGISTYF